LVMNNPLKTESIAIPANHTVNILIGDVCCALRCEDDEICNRFKQLYHDFLTEQTADITVELIGTDRLNPEDMYEALAETVYIHGDGEHFKTSSQVISGQYDLTHQFIRITGEKSLVDPAQEFNHLNRLLSLVYYSACKIKYDGNIPAMLVHSCGVRRNGQVLVFAGPSEAGKTTIARLCGDQDGEVINDEMVLVSRPAPDGRGISVQNAPIISTLSPWPKTTAPLGCVFFLKKSQRTQARRLEKSDAYLRFMRQIISPAYIGQRDKRAIFQLMADFSVEVTGAVPFYELEFTLDAEALWREVGKFDAAIDHGE
jgi:hypothetical protein